MGQQFLRTIFGEKYDIEMEKARAEGREEGRAKGYREPKAEGFKKGREYGIRALVIELRRLSTTQEEAADELKNLYDLSAEEAAAKVALYWQADAPEK